MAEKDDVDTRVEFISDYVLKALKQKMDKWAKFITGDERHILFRFFDLPKYDIIVFRMNTAGLLTCATNFPPINRGKMVYFLRNLDDKLTQANFRKSVTIGEMSGNVLMDISVMADEVIGPLLCNPGNQKGWPKIVVNDMKRHVDDLRNLMHQLKGEMTSQVMLPMPAGVENIYHAEAKLKESDGEDVDLHLKTNIEGAIIKWTQQVHDLLKEDSYIAFKRTKFPLPIADIDFYINRLKNLEGIYTQLRDPRVKRMAHYLEDTRSVYLSCFRTMLTNVVAAIVECRDIYVYQRPLQIHFEGFEGTDFQDAKYLIRLMFHCIGMLWENSRYYCNVEKLIQPVGAPAAKKPRVSLASGVTSRDVSLAEAAKHGTLQEYNYFDRVRRALRSQEVYDNFLRKLITPENVNCRDSHGRNSTPLHLAAGYNNLEVAEALLEAGAAVAARDKGGLVPLHNAASYGHVELAALLLRAGTDPNANDRWGFTPLHEAAHKARTQLASLLLAHGADPFLKNQEGQTALDLAAAADVRSLLCDAKAGLAAPQ